MLTKIDNMTELKKIMPIRCDAVISFTMQQYIKCSKRDTWPFSQTRNIKKYKLPSVFARHLSLIPLTVLLKKKKQGDRATEPKGLLRLMDCI